MSEESEPVVYIGRKRAAILAMLGGLVATVLDTAAHADPFCSKFGLALHKLFGTNQFFAVETAGAVFAIGCAGGIAYLTQFSKDHGAATAGLMIFTTLSTYMPTIEGTSVVHKQVFDHERVQIIELAQLRPASISSYLTRDKLSKSNLVSRPGKVWLADGPEFRPDAKAKQNLWVSTCKPSYYGFLGLGSFFNNSVRTCPSSVKLTKNTSIQVIRRWKTLARSYHYAEVKFRFQGELISGWIPTGNIDDPWRYLEVPDDSAARNIEVE